MSPKSKHRETHFTSGEIVRDIVIGMSDGLTVPFALAAGLSGAIANSGLVVTAGVAEVAAGSIAMGLGGYLAARGEAEHYDKERHREWCEVKEMPEEESREIFEIFRAYGLKDEEIQPVVAGLERNHEHWIDFMMKYELALDKPDPNRGLISALVIAGSYVVGGIVPLVPYMIYRDSHFALAISAIVTVLALFVFGYVKGRFTGSKPFRSAFQTAVVGTLAALAAFAIAKLISPH
ncbi:MAG: VIT1/CCC1 transporter family protein [Candidatus Obscuribacterales bacterium]